MNTRNVYRESYRLERLLVKCNQGGSVHSLFRIQLLTLYRQNTYAAIRGGWSWYDCKCRAFSGKVPKKD